MPVDVLEQDSPQSTELTALRDLLASEGWRLFLAMADQEWGAEAVIARVEARVGAVPVGDQEAVDDAAQHVISARKHIWALLNRPKTRVEQLQHEAAPLSMREKASRLLAARGPRPDLATRRMAR